MKEEIQSAVKYWGNLLGSHTPHTTKQTFQHNLSSLLEEKFTSHWHVDTPEKGQAYREILCDFSASYVDPILIKAASASGFDFIELYSFSRGIRMWIDPGEVEVTFTEGRSKKILYHQQKRSSSLSPPPAAVQFRGPNDVVYFYETDNTPNYYQNNGYLYKNMYGGPGDRNTEMYPSHLSDRFVVQHDIEAVGM